MLFGRSAEMVNVSFLDFRFRLHSHKVLDHIDICKGI
jgi:hypothetical protein